MVETLALLALPFGMIVQRIAARGKLAVAGLIAVVLVCIGLNMFQQWQYLHGILHYEDMNAERYWNAFGAMSQEAAGVLPAP